MALLGESVCPYCGVGCRLRVEGGDDGITRVRGVESAPANLGRLCAKGAVLGPTVHTPDRAKFPLVRRSRSEPLKRASWDEALDRVAAKFQRIIADHGPDAVAFILSANLHRRHLSPGQQAMIVAAAADWSKAQGVGRPDQSGNATGLQTVADRAAMSGASDKTQRGADAVAKADPELTRQVSHGEISLPKAVEKITGKRPGTRKSAADNEHVADAELEVARARIIKLDALIVERDARIVELEALSAEMLAEMSTITLRDGDARLFDQAA